MLRTGLAVIKATVDATRKPHAHQTYLLTFVARDELKITAIRHTQTFFATPGDEANLFEAAVVQIKFTLPSG